MWDNFGMAAAVFTVCKSVAAAASWQSDGAMAEMGFAEFHIVEFKSDSAVLVGRKPSMGTET